MPPARESCTSPGVVHSGERRLERPARCGCDDPIAGARLCCPRQDAAEVDVNFAHGGPTLISVGYSKGVRGAQRNVHFGAAPVCATGAGMWYNQCDLGRGCVTTCSAWRRCARSRLARRGLGTDVTTYLGMIYNKRVELEVEGEMLDISIKTTLV